MKNKKTEAEHANQKIDEFFNGDNQQESLDIEPLLSNNNRLLVIEGQDEEENK